jgi:hypothetical protein
VVQRKAGGVNPIPVSLTEATLAFPHPNRFGASRTGRREPEHAERRAKHCKTNTDEKGNLRTTRWIARQEQRHQRRRGFRFQLNGREARAVDKIVFLRVC